MKAVVPGKKGARSHALARRQVFDLALHGRKAADEFRRIRQRYETFSEALKRLLDGLLEAKNVRVHSVERRAKTVESFQLKASKCAEDRPNAPKYPKPLKNVTDLAGVRVITFLPRDAKRVDGLVSSEFEVLERIDKGADIDLGYQSIHYVVRLSSSRSRLPENRAFVGMVAEIQIRTILQHAWAEIQHDIVYKSLTDATRSIRRRFATLAGMLDLADREFQLIHEEAGLVDYLRRSQMTKRARSRPGQGAPAPLMEGPLLQDTWPGGSPKERPPGATIGRKRRSTS